MDKQIYFFPINIEPCEEGGFLATCETLQGCLAEGETYGQAIENIQDVIKIHLEARKKFNDFTPSVSMPATSNLKFSLPLPISM